MLSLFLGIAVCQSESPFSGTAYIKWMDKVTGVGYKDSAFWLPEMQIWRTSLAPEFLIGLLLLLSRISHCLTLCNPIDGNPLGSPVPGILQARTLKLVAISFSNAWKWKVKSESEVAHSCPTLHDPMDCSLPGSSVHGIFQARVLE